MRFRTLDPARFSGWQAALLAVVAGVLTVPAFAPFGIWPLAIIGPSILFRLLQAPGIATGAGFRLGYLFGLGLLGAGVSWLYISIGQFGAITLPMAVGLTLAFILFIALYYGLFAYLALRLGEGRAVWAQVLIFAALWSLLEWLRGWLLTGFPWLTLGTALIDSPLAGFIPVLGDYGLGLLAALQAALLWQLRRVWAWVPILAAWLAGMALGGVSWVQPEGQPLKVSLIQGNIEQRLKWRPEQFRPTLQRYLELTDRAIDSRLVIWPETAVPAFAHQVEDILLRPLDAEARARGQDILLGLPIRKPTGGYTNSMLNLGLSGRAAYDKQHLVPFGEFLPFKAWLGPLMDWLRIPMSDFSNGSDKRPLLTLAGLPAGISICYEDAFGAEVAQALPEAAFLVNASNDAWFGDSLAPHQHLQIARVRALESGRYLLRATNTGISAIIDPSGRLVSVSPQFQAAVLSGDIQPFSGATPFVSLGNGLAVFLALLLLFTGISGVRRETGA